MSIPLVVKSKLCWKYNGERDVCWYLGLGDYTSVARQDAYLRDMDRFGANTITLNLMNEELSSVFSGEFMQSSLHEGKLKLLGDFIGRLKNSGKIVVITYFDCPPADHPKYPFWRYSDRLAPFLELATPPLAKIVDGFILGIETNRGPCSMNIVEAGIGLIQKHAVRNGVKLPVSTHEQNVGWKHGKPYLKRRVPRNGDFVAYETSNHPYDGGNVSVARMVDEVQFLVAHSGGKGVWVVESNNREDAHARAQNQAMAEIPGVIGVGGPV